VALGLDDAVFVVGDDASDRNPAPQNGDAEPGKTSAHVITRVGFVF